MDYKVCVGVVTGANSGMGFKITERLLEMGMTVVGLDKNIYCIKDKDKNLTAMEVDLTKQEDISKAFKWIEDHLERVDVLVNNAGLNGTTSLMDGDISEWRKILYVHVLAVAQCTVEAVNIMKKRKSQGHIINITRQYANEVINNGPCHFYTATKYSAKALTEGFKHELKDLEPPIKIASIEPFLTKTGIFLNSMGKEKHKDVYDTQYYMEPTDIADTVEFILKTPPHMQVCNVNLKHVNFQEY